MRVINPVALIMIYLLFSHQSDYRFDGYRNKLFSGRSILPFIVIICVTSNFLFSPKCPVPAKQEKRSHLPHISCTQLRYCKEKLFPLVVILLVGKRVVLF